jgi:hypothetical protein
LVAIKTASILAKFLMLLVLKPWVDLYFKHDTMVFVSFHM